MLWDIISNASSSLTFTVYRKVGNCKRTFYQVNSTRNSSACILTEYMLFRYLSLNHTYSSAHVSGYFYMFITMTPISQLIIIFKFLIFDYLNIFWESLGGEDICEDNVSRLMSKSAKTVQCNSCVSQVISQRIRFSKIVHFDLCRFGRY